MCGPASAQGFLAAEPVRAPVAAAEDVDGTEPVAPAR